MSRPSANLLYLLFTLFSVLLAPFCTGQAALQMAYGYDYRPFAWAEDGEMKGLQVDIIREAIEKRLNIPVVHRGYPWRRAQMMVERGEADGLFTIGTPERHQYTQAGEEALITVRNTLYTYKDHEKLEDIQTIRTVEDLKDYRLVDYIGGSWSKSELQGTTLIRVSEMAYALEFLSKKRADIFIQSDQVTDYNINKLGLKGRLVKTDVVFSSEQHRLLIRKDSEFIRLLPQIDAVIREMRRDGTLRAIYNRYR